MSRFICECGEPAAYFMVVKVGPNREGLERKYVCAGCGDGYAEQGRKVRAKALAKVAGGSER